MNRQKIREGFLMVPEADRPDCFGNVSSLFTLHDDLPASSF